jgi:hypothetical protein
MLFTDITEAEPVRCRYTANIVEFILSYFLKLKFVLTLFNHLRLTSSPSALVFMQVTDQKGVSTRLLHLWPISVTSFHWPYVRITWEPTFFLCSPISPSNLRPGRVLIRTDLHIAHEASRVDKQWVKGKCTSQDMKYLTHFKSNSVLESAINIILLVLCTKCLPGR